MMETVQRSNYRLRKELLRKQAEQRQAEHDGLTPEQKLEVLAGRPGESARERARLEPLVQPVKKPRPRRRVKRHVS